MSKYPVIKPIRNLHTNNKSLLINKADIVPHIQYLIEKNKLKDAFIEASFHNEKEYFYFLIDKVDINDNKKALDWAIWNENIEFIQALLERGTVVKYTDIEYIINPEIKNLLNLYYKLQQ